MNVSDMGSHFIQVISLNCFCVRTHYFNKYLLNIFFFKKYSNFYN